MRRDMPNWCECDLFIDGPAERVKAFLDTMRGEQSPFDFEKVLPYPEHFRALDRLAAEWDKKSPEERQGGKRPGDGYNRGGYEWCCTHWGTKWNACFVTVGQVEPSHVSDQPAGVTVSFSTPWTPPFPVIKLAARTFPELTLDLRYYERGACFHGVFRCSAGEILEDRRGEYFGTRGG
jgi:hypothetical protein